MRFVILLAPLLLATPGHADGLLRCSITQVHEIRGGRIVASDERNRFRKEYFSPLIVDTKSGIIRVGVARSIWRFVITRQGADNDLVLEPPERGTGIYISLRTWETPIQFFFVDGFTFNSGECINVR